MTEKTDQLRARLVKFLTENEIELRTYSVEDRDLTIFQEGYIAGLERAVETLTAPKNILNIK